jgi:hypothetical protein
VQAADHFQSAVRQSFLLEAEEHPCCKSLRSNAELVVRESPASKEVNMEAELSTSLEAVIRQPVSFRNVTPGLEPICYREVQLRVSTLLHAIIDVFTQSAECTGSECKSMGLQKIPLLLGSANNNGCTLVCTERDNPEEAPNPNG